MKARADAPDPAAAITGWHVRRGADRGVLQEAWRLCLQVLMTERGVPIDGGHGPRPWEAADAAGAEHLCAFDRAGNLVGCTWLLPGSRCWPLPFESDHRLDAGFDRPPPAQCAELGPLVVRSDYRRRGADTAAGLPLEPAAASIGTGERRHAGAQVPLALLHQAVACSRELGVRWWFSVLEPDVARALACLDLGFRPVGPLVGQGGFGPHLLDLQGLPASWAADAPRAASAPSSPAARSRRPAEGRTGRAQARRRSGPGALRAGSSGGRS